MEADIIVVGGGSAGCAMAARLAQAGVRVLLLEAGKTGNHYRLRIPALTSTVVQNEEFDWKYKCSSDPSIGGRSDVWPGGKRLGGGSSINGMIYVRGHRWDYDNWVRMGAAGWSYDECLPYFRRMERYEKGLDAWHGGDGPIGVSAPRVHYPIVDSWVQAASEIGPGFVADHNGPEPAAGTAYAQATQWNGLRSSAVGYFKLPGVKQNIEINLESRVTRLLIDGRRVTGVEVEQNGQRRRIRARAGVVVSSGSMNSPRLLMLSGIGPGAHLREHGLDVAADMPGVGANLQEHVGTHVVHAVNTPTINSEAHGIAAIRNGLDFLFRRRGIITASMAHGQSFITTRDDAPAPNLQISFTAFAFDLDEQGKLQMRRTPAVSTVVCVSRPRARGRLLLRSPDAFDAPVIDHHLLGDERDLDDIVAGIQHIRRIMRHPKMQPYVTEVIRPADAFEGEQLRMYARMAAFPMYHPVGTCRMGTGEGAVTDADLKVHGFDNLWIADASVMPSLPAGNTNGTAIMIGDKGSAHVLKGLGKTPAVA